MKVEKSICCIVEEMISFELIPTSWLTDLMCVRASTSMLQKLGILSDRDGRAEARQHKQRLIVGSLVRLSRLTVMLVTNNNTLLASS